jgi:hypothetical protein
MQIRIPFELNEGDIDTTVILLTDVAAGIIRLRVETPTGDIINPTVVAGLGGTFGLGTNMSYYRFTLPVPPIGGGGSTGAGSHAGTWYALLEINVVEFRKAVSSFNRRNSAAIQSVVAHGFRYSLSVQSYSNLRMDARLTQNSFELGAKMTLRVVLTEYGLPLAHRATVTAELKKPDNTFTTLSLSEIEDGVFETSITDTTISGVYRFHIFASGATLRGVAFTRQKFLTGGVFHGGDAPPPTTSGGIDQGDLCRLIECLLNKEYWAG